MNVLRFLYWLAIVCSYAAISAIAGQHDSAPPRYRIDIVDRPEEKRFLIVLKSLDDRSLCLGIGQWPNEFGQLDFGSTWVALKSAGDTYRPRDTNFGYCPGCEIRIAPRSELRGFIGYAEFADPATIAALPKRHLHFPVTAWICKKQNRARAASSPKSAITP
jgi:hypothetical protein